MSKTAILYSNTPPSREQEEKFIEFLSAKYGEDISLVWKQEELQEGSFRLRIGSELYDWTAAGRLWQLKEALRSIKSKGDDIVPLLRDTLVNWTPKALAHEQGRVVTVGDGIATVTGLENATYGEILIFTAGIRGMVQYLRQDEIGCSLFGSDRDVSEGSRCGSRGDVSEGGKTGRRGGQAELRTVRPLRDERIRIGQEEKAVTPAPEFQQLVEVALRQIEDIAFPGIGAFFRRQVPADVGAESLPEFLAGNAATLQVAENAALDTGIQLGAGVPDADLLKTADRLLVPEVEHHAAHVEYQILHHNRYDSILPTDRSPQGLPDVHHDDGRVVQADFQPIGHLLDVGFRQRLLGTGDDQGPCLCPEGIGHDFGTA